MISFISFLLLPPVSQLLRYQWLYPFPTSHGGSAVFPPVQGHAFFCALDLIPTNTPLPPQGSGTLFLQLSPLFLISSSSLLRLASSHSHTHARLSYLKINKNFLDSMFATSLCSSAFKKRRFQLLPPFSYFHSVLNLPHSDFHLPALHSGCFH